MAGWNKIAKEVPSPPFALCNIVPGIRVVRSIQRDGHARHVFVHHSPLISIYTDNYTLHGKQQSLLLLLCALPGCPHSFHRLGRPLSLSLLSPSFETFFASESTTETRLRSLSPLSSHFSIRKIKGIGINATVPDMTNVAYCLYPLYLPIISHSACTQFFVFYFDLFFRRIKFVFDTNL